MKTNIIVTTQLTQTSMVTSAENANYLLLILNKIYLFFQWTIAQKYDANSIV